MSYGNGNSGSGIARREGTEILSGETGEVLDYRESPSALEAVTRAEIDIQIATAKRFPRSFSEFLAMARSMVSVDPELASQCTYYLPARTGKKDDPPISGPSVRLAEIVAVCWGNLRIVTRVIDDDGKAITAQGVAIDLEKNVGYSGEIRRQVASANGRRYSDNMVNLTCNAACAIAGRNATFKVVPRAFVNLVSHTAQAIARGDEKTLPDRTRAAIEFLRAKGVREEDVFRTLGIRGHADMSLDHLMVLRGYVTSVSEGHGTIEEIFAAPKPEAAAQQAPGESRTEALSRKLAEAPQTPTPTPAGPETKGGRKGQAMPLATAPEPPGRESGSD